MGFGKSFKKFVGGAGAFLGHPFVTAAAGSVLDYNAQKDANAANARMAEDQMGFQRYMSGTAHQREVQDLIKAGLNPILSADGGGASTPSGAMATSEPAFSGVANSALSASRLRNEIKLMEKSLEESDSRIRLNRLEGDSKLPYGEIGKILSRFISKSPTSSRTILDLLGDSLESRAQKGYITRGQQKDLESREFGKGSRRGRFGVYRDSD